MTDTVLVEEASKKTSPPYQGKHWIVHHLVERGICPSRHRFAYDEETATFMLYNGPHLVGYHVYRPFATKKLNNDPRSGRYYTYLPEKTDGVWGLEQDDGRGTLFVVEGLFKAAKLHYLGQNAIAVLGATPKRLKPLFRIWRATRKLVAIGDNDSAGQQLVRIVKEGCVSPRDLDEMDNLEVYELIKEYR